MVVCFHQMSFFGYLVVPTPLKPIPELFRRSDLRPAFGVRQRLATQNRKTQTNLAENARGRSAPVAQFRPAGSDGMLSTRGRGYMLSSFDMLRREIYIIDPQELFT